MGNIIQTNKKTTVNGNGEFVEEEKEQIIRYPKTEDFVMTFTKDLGYMKDLTKGEMLVMFGFLQNVSNNNEVVLNKSIKERICNQFDLLPTSMNQLISNLKKKKMIISKERGIYILNTNIFGKGKWNEVKKLRMLIEWDFKSQTKKVLVEQTMLNEEEILEKQINQQKIFLEELEKQKQKKSTTDTDTKSLFED